jgi:hypothetical protein
LQIAKSDPMQWLAHRFNESLGVGSVGPLGMAAATVEPQVNQVLV